MSNWIKIKTMPPVYGRPVLIVVGGVSQSCSFELQGREHCEDMFIGYVSYGERKVFLSDVEEWQPLPISSKEARQ